MKERTEKPTDFLLIVTHFSDGNTKKGRWKEEIRKREEETESTTEFAIEILIPIESLVARKFYCSKKSTRRKSRRGRKSVSGRLRDSPFADSALA